MHSPLDSGMAACTLGRSFNAFRCSQPIRNKIRLGSPIHDGFETPPKFFRWLPLSHTVQGGGLPPLLGRKRNLCNYIKWHLSKATLKIKYRQSHPGLFLISRSRSPVGVPFLCQSSVLQVRKGPSSWKPGPWGFFDSYYSTIAMKDSFDTFPLRLKARGHASVTTAICARSWRRGLKRLSDLLKVIEEAKKQSSL